MKDVVEYMEFLFEGQEKQKPALAKTQPLCHCSNIDYGYYI